MQIQLGLLVVMIFVFEVVSGKQYCQKYVVKGGWINQVRSWENARKACEKLGMSLVKIDHGAEDKFLRKFLKKEMSLGFFDGWYIGGVYSQGSWKWTDKSPMFYKNFAAVEQREFSLSQDVTNYAFIKKDDYKWGYVSPFGTQRMGYICESTDCNPEILPICPYQ
nr:perlucin-like protein isoform X2 [Crassostrea gigas]|eukprot:XP_011433207.1 PREDICTED: perlucin-like protein [Crassostrea gigas]